MNQREMERHRVMYGGKMEVRDECVCLSATKSFSSSVKRVAGWTNLAREEENMDGQGKIRRGTRTRDLAVAPLLLLGGTPDVS